MQTMRYTCCIVCFTKVVINGLYSTENNQVINFDRPVKAVAMDPMFYKSGSGKHFVTGDDKVRFCSFD